MKNGKIEIYYIYSDSLGEEMQLLIHCWITISPYINMKH